MAKGLQKWCTIPEAVVQRYAKGWLVLRNRTGQYGPLVLHTALKNWQNNGTNRESTANYLQNGWSSVGKTPNGQWTTKYGVERVTGNTGMQNISVNGMPRHVRDLRPIVGPGPQMACSDTPSDRGGERFITINEMLGERTHGFHSWCLYVDAVYISRYNQMICFFSPRFCN